MTDPEPLTIDELQAKLREIWDKHKHAKPTITVRPDGFYEDDEPDTDEGPLAEGDFVRWNFWKTGLFKGNLEPFGGRRPYTLGIVKNADPDRCLPGHVGVVMSTGGSGQFPREMLRRHDLST